MSDGNNNSSNPLSSFWGMLSTPEGREALLETGSAMYQSAANGDNTAALVGIYDALEQYREDPTSTALDDVINTYTLAGEAYDTLTGDTSDQGPNADVSAQSVGAEDVAAVAALFKDVIDANRDNVALVGANELNEGALGILLGDIQEAAVTGNPDAFKDLSAEQQAELVVALLPFANDPAHAGALAALEKLPIGDGDMQAVMSAVVEALPNVATLYEGMDDATQESFKTLLTATLDGKDISELDFDTVTGPILDHAMELINDPDSAADLASIVSVLDSLSGEGNSKLSAAVTTVSSLVDQMDDETREAMTALVKDALSGDPLSIDFSNVTPVLEHILENDPDALEEVMDALETLSGGQIDPKTISLLEATNTLLTDLSAEGNEELKAEYIATLDFVGEYLPVYNQLADPSITGQQRGELYARQSELLSEMPTNDILAVLPDLIVRAKDDPELQGLVDDITQGLLDDKAIQAVELFGNINNEIYSAEFKASFPATEDYSYDDFIAEVDGMKATLLRNVLLGRDAGIEDFDLEKMAPNLVGLLPDYAGDIQDVLENYKDEIAASGVDVQQIEAASAGIGFIDEINDAIAKMEADAAELRNPPSGSPTAEDMARADELEAQAAKYRETFAQLQAEYMGSGDADAGADDAANAEAIARIQTQNDAIQAFDTFLNAPDGYVARSSEPNLSVADRAELQTQLDEAKANLNNAIPGVFEQYQAQQASTGVSFDDFLVNEFAVRQAQINELSSGSNLDQQKTAEFLQFAMEYVDEEELQAVADYFGVEMDEKDISDAATLITHLRDTFDYIDSDEFIEFMGLEDASPEEISKIREDYKDAGQDMLAGMAEPDWFETQDGASMDDVAAFAVLYASTATEEEKQAIGNVIDALQEQIESAMPAELEGKEQSVRFALDMLKNLDELPEGQLQELNQDIVRAMQSDDDLDMINVLTTNVELLDSYVNGPIYEAAVLRQEFKDYWDNHPQGEEYDAARDELERQIEDLEAEASKRRIDGQAVLAENNAGLAGDLGGGLLGFLAPFLGPIMDWIEETFGFDAGGMVEDFAGLPEGSLSKDNISAANRVLNGPSEADVSAWVDKNHGITLSPEVSAETAASLSAAAAVAQGVEVETGASVSPIQTPDSVAQQDVAEPSVPAVNANVSLATNTGSATTLNEVAYDASAEMEVLMGRQLNEFNPALFASVSSIQLQLEQATSILQDIVECDPNDLGSLCPLPTIGAGVERQIAI